jgi:hypothetical protein
MPNASLRNNENTMELKNLIGGYNDIKGQFSRSQHLVRELINVFYALLLVTSFVNSYNRLFLWLLMLLPVELIAYRLSVIRRLHDLDVAQREINTTFWQPVFGCRLWWRLLFEKGKVR